MTLRDRILFHEIHPVKLETNLGSGIFCLYFLWEQSDIKKARYDSEVRS
jgi:hypothetical protein